MQVVPAVQRQCQSICIVVFVGQAEMMFAKRAQLGVPNKPNFHTGSSKLSSPQPLVINSCRFHYGDRLADTN